MYFRVFVLNRFRVSKSQRLTYAQILYEYPPPLPLGGLNVTIHLSRPLFLLFSPFRNCQFGQWSRSEYSLSEGWTCGYKMEWPWAIYVRHRLAKSRGSLIVIWLSSCRLIRAQYSVKINMCIPKELYNWSILIRSWSRSYGKFSSFCVFKDFTRICYVRSRLRDSPLNWESVNTKRKPGGIWGEQRGRRLSLPSQFSFFPPPPQLFKGFFFRVFLTIWEPGTGSLPKRIHWKTFRHQVCEPESWTPI